ncbi:MAG: hypothetical protein JWM68_3326 [Verrucomicrobiales bacterium]|nr:hypothetical protein [Verrucomicrobiales bacterium]
MRQFRARSGPFATQLRFSTKEIDQLCVDALAKVDLLPAAPAAIRIDRFVEKYFDCPLVYEDMGPGVLGCTIFNDTGGVVAVIVSPHLADGSQVSERRLRSTIAHEAGHGLLHPVLFMASPEQEKLKVQTGDCENVDFARRRILCRDSDVSETAGRKGYDKRWWEWQANRAIGGFLLPEKLVRQSVDRFTNASVITGSKSLPAEKRTEAEQWVAEIFDVNPIVARIRLSELFPCPGAQITF